MKVFKQVGFYNFVMIFIVGCLAGWFWEVAFAFLKHGEFLNRSSLIFGPFGGAYGIGAVLLTIFLYNYKNKPLSKIFLMTALIGTVAEYIFSLGQEIVCGYTSWNYSHMPFNINGRVCLLYSLSWGFLGIFWVKFMYPFLERELKKCNLKSIKRFVHVFLVFFVINCLITFPAMERRKERFYNEQPSNKIEEIFDKYLPDDIMDWIFPNAKIVKK